MGTSWVSGAMFLKKTVGLLPFPLSLDLQAVKEAVFLQHMLPVIVIVGHAHLTQSNGWAWPYTGTKENILFLCYFRCRISDQES